MRSRRRPVVLEMGQTLAGPPDVIWRLITDWELQGAWMLEASDFVITSERQAGVGVEGEATIRIAGIRTRDKVRIVTWEPNKRLGIRHEGWISGEGEMLLTQLGSDRTHLFWREELFPPLGPFGALSLAAFRPVMQRIFERDLRVLAGLVRVAVGG
jgi:uncharacterized protein YndB with AHSA1/START domain